MTDKPENKQDPLTLVWVAGAGVLGYSFGIIGSLVIFSFALGATAITTRLQGRVDDKGYRDKLRVGYGVLGAVLYITAIAFLLV